LIGEVFDSALSLFKQAVWMLLLAGLIVVAIFAGATVLVSAVVAQFLKGIVRTSTLTGPSPSSLIGAFTGTILISGIVATIVIMVFSGGFFQMLVGAYRENRQIRLADLFAGFRRIGAYATMWACWAGAGLVVQLVVILSAKVLGPASLLVALLGLGVMVWLCISWIYGVILIVDRGMGGVAALRESMEMVRGAGWWSTFGALFVLWLTFFVVSLVISYVGAASRSPYASVGLIIAFNVFAYPFSICYVAAMYLASGRAPAVAGGGGYGAPPTPAPMGVYGASALPAAPDYRPAPTSAYGAPAPAPAAATASAGADADAWRAASDPLFALSLHAPGPARSGGGAPKQPDAGRGVPRQAPPRPSQAASSADASPAPPAAPGRGVPRQAPPLPSRNAVPEAPPAPSAPAPPPV
jgi:hypothetical protein